MRFINLFHNELSLLIILNCLHYRFDNRWYYLISCIAYYITLFELNLNVYRILSFISSRIVPRLASSCLLSSCLCLTIKENFCDKCLMSYATWRKRRNRMQAELRGREREGKYGVERENSSGNAIICNQTNPNALRVYQCHNLCVVALPLCVPFSPPTSRYDQ